MNKDTLKKTLLALGGAAAITAAGLGVNEVVKDEPVEPLYTFESSCPGGDPIIIETEREYFSLRDALFASLDKGAPLNPCFLEMHADIMNIETHGDPVVFDQPKSTTLLKEARKKIIEGNLEEIINK